MRERFLAVPWRIVLLASYVGVNAILIPLSIRLGESVSIDWVLWREMPAAVASGSIYEVRAGVPFVWSPVVAWFMAVVAVVGYWPWVLVHIASVFALRDRLLIGLVLVSFGFWFDVAQGNTFSFAVIAGLLALRGSRGGELAYLAMVVLIPRPIQIPLAVWLLWRDSSLRRPFAAMLAIHALVVIGSGYALPWLETLIRYTPPVGVTIGPTAWFDRWWLVAGIPLGAWLTWRGHPGWAGLAISPYILPQYLMWPVMEVGPARRVLPAGRGAATTLRAAAPRALPERTRESSN